MKNLITLILGFTLIVGCSQSQIQTNLNETLVVRNNGADMPVYLHGDVTSKVIMLVVHGGPGGSGLEYRSGRYVEELEKDFALAYWDQRGQGMSHGHYTNEDLTVAQMTEDLNAVIISLRHKYGQDIKLFLFGHSWGGTLTSNYMVTGDYQNNVAGWIESNGAHDIPMLNVEAIKMFRQVADEQLNARNNTDYWTDIKNWANGLDTNEITTEQGGEINQKGFEAEGKLEEDGVVAESDQDGLTNPLINGRTNPLTSFISGSITNQKLAEEVENTALTSQLVKVTKPTLIISGKYDFVVPPVLGVSAYNTISSKFKEFVLFEKSGHSPMNNEWELYTNTIADFIEKHK